MKSSHLAIIFLFCLAVGIMIAIHPVLSFLIAGLFLLIDGILSLFTPTLIWLIRIANKLHGVETNITKNTIMWWKFWGVILIFLGGFLLYIFLRGGIKEFLY